jgi:hypothetical protein
MSQKLNQTFLHKNHCKYRISTESIRTCLLLLKLVVLFSTVPLILIISVISVWINCVYNSLLSKNNTRHAKKWDGLMFLKHAQKTAAGSELHAWLPQERERCTRVPPPKSDKKYLGLLGFWTLCPPSDIPKNIMFWKLDLFPSTGEGVGDTYPVGSVKRS